MQITINIFFFIMALGFTVLTFLKKFEERKEQLENFAEWFWIFFSISLIFDIFLIGNVMYEKTIESKIYIYTEENKQLKEEIQSIESMINELKELINNSYDQSVEDMEAYLDSLSSDAADGNSIRITSNDGNAKLLSLSYYNNSPDIYLNLDMAYQEKMALYNYNDKKINDLKEKKINTRIYKYLLYFGW